MTRKRREAGSLESEVLGLLWASGTALTTSEVLDGLSVATRPLAYTTVQTILTRLHAKGAVQRELTGRAHAYTPVLDDAALAANRMRALLDRGSDRAAVLQCFVGSLTSDEEHVLRELLTDQRTEGDDS